MRRKFGGIVLVLCVMIALLSCVSVYADADSGKCGDNLIWTLDSEGTLTISGEGDMFDWSLSSPPPWGSNSEHIKALIIENGATSIGTYAFFNCINLTDISIADTVIHIDNCAFEDCFALTDITIPDSVTDIADWAFWRCRNLTNVEIGQGLNDIGTRAFGECLQLARIDVAAGNKSYKSVNGVLFSYDGTVLYKCPAAKEGSYLIPNGVTSINDYAFCDCRNLTEIIIRNGIINIGHCAFGYCEGITKMTIPDSVINIGEYAFLGCFGLQELTLSSGMTNISEHMVESCHSLEYIEIPSSITTICSFAFSECTALRSLTVPNSVKTIEAAAFAYCDFDITELYEVYFMGTQDEWDEIEIGISNDIVNYANVYYYDVTTGKCGDNLTWTLDKGTLTISGSGAMSTYAPWDDNNAISIKKVVLSEEITSIGANIFSGCRMTSITIPKNVNIVPDGAFSGCEKLLQINVASGNTSYKAVDGVLLSYDGTLLHTCPCGKEEAYTIPDGVAAIGNRAFDGCYSLTEIKIPSSVTDIGERAFYNCQNITAFTLPDDITSIGVGAFWRCLHLADINIPSSVTNIAARTFEDCENLNTIAIPNKVTHIGDYAFMDCTSLENMTIPNGVTDIGDAVFEGCENITAITIPDSVKSIGYATFSGCQSLTSITIPYGITNIGPDMFSNCFALTRVDLPDSVTEIEAGAFYGCIGLRSIKIPETVSVIDDGAFCRCESLKRIKLPYSITRIGDHAFAYCEELSDIYYAGTEPQWNMIDIDESNEPLASATMNFNSNSFPFPALAEISAITYKEGIYTVEASIVDIPYSCRIIAVLYNGDELCGVSNAELNPSDTSKQIEVGSTEAADQAHVFIWDSLLGMKPLCNIVKQDI